VLKWKPILLSRNVRIAKSQHRNNFDLVARNFRISDSLMINEKSASPDLDCFQPKMIKCTNTSIIFA
jgi:hypothetical protein